MTRIKLILTALMFLAAMPVQAQWRCGRGGGELLDGVIVERGAERGENLFVIPL